MDRIARINEFLQANPKDNFLRHALALEYLKLEEDTMARSLFEAILTESPEYVGSYYHLAKLLEKLQERELAITWYEKGNGGSEKSGRQPFLQRIAGGLRGPGVLISHKFTD
jgi:tetratricopeptide (TPR) repeat protein